jgi:hypothetical protein
MISRGKADARELAHARILLQADEAGGGPARADGDVASAPDVGVRTVGRVRRRFVEQGLAAALPPEPSPRLDGREPGGGAGGAPARVGLRGAAPGQGALVAAAAGRAHGRAGARRHALARDRPSSARRNEIRPHLRKMRCMPPKRPAEFVCHTEDVLGVHHRPRDPKRPVVCSDETFRRLIGEARGPPPPAPGRVERYDRGHVRNGTAGLFLAGARPPAGAAGPGGAAGRPAPVAVTEGRRRTDRARSVEGSLDGRHTGAGKVVPVMGQLGTRSPASLYDAFPPEEAGRLAERLEIHHTPKHGSWLSMAEVELGALARDLPERVGSRPDLERHVAAWERRRNGAGVTARWRFTTADARIRLRKLYPTLGR